MTHGLTPLPVTLPSTPPAAVHVSPIYHSALVQKFKVCLLPRGAAPCRDGGGPRHQGPSTKLQANPKYQPPTCAAQCCFLGVWRLELVWNLGSWFLEFLPRDPAPTGLGHRTPRDCPPLPSYSRGFSLGCPLRPSESPTAEPAWRFSACDSSSRRYRPTRRCYLTFLKFVGGRAPIRPP